MISRAIKRIFDYVFAVLVGIFAIPIILVTMLVIRIKSPEDSPLFKQIRTGYKCKPKDENGNLLPDEKRLKGWGKVIRKLSIDELSQIFNIFSGQMSWIGPRPLLPKEMLVMTEDEQKERQSVLPGITGWEAVNEEKSDDRRAMAEYDLEYVRNWSLGFDAKIFFMTVKKIFKADRSDEAHRAPKLDEKEFRSTKVAEEKR